MWRVWNKLFGWHHAMWLDFDGELFGYRRVYVLPDGRRYIFRHHRYTSFITPQTIREGKVIPLTWSEREVKLVDEA